MLEILKFIFSSFWVWLGVAIIIGTICAAIGLLFNITITHHTVHTIKRPNEPKGPRQ